MTESVCCYLGLGSNLNSPERQLRLAIHKLRHLPHSVITRLSHLYKSKPYGVSAQPPYQNMVIELYTSLPEKRLLTHCQQIENKQGRVRKKHWGSRTLDIDILLYGDKTIDTPSLRIPHPEMLKRDFVLIPLLEISPTIRLPSGQPISSFNLESLKPCVVPK